MENGFTIVIQKKKKIYIYIYIYVYILHAIENLSKKGEGGAVK